MLRLLPSPARVAEPEARRTAPAPSAPAKGLVYTLLRHGRGLPASECARRMNALLPHQPDDGPFRAA